MFGTGQDWFSDEWLAQQLLWTAALLGAAAGWAIKSALPVDQPIVVAAAVLIPYGLVYLVLTLILQIVEARNVANILARRLHLRRN